MTTINTIILAVRAEYHADKPFEDRLFGKFTGKVLGRDQQCGFTASRYAYVGSPLALTLWAPDDHGIGIWEQYTDLTVNVRPNDCKPNECVVKTYSENDHIRDAMLGSGFFQDTGRRVKVGFTEAEIWSLTDSFIEAFDQVHPELEAQ